MKGERAVIRRVLPSRPHGACELQLSVEEGTWQLTVWHAELEEADIQQAKVVYRQALSEGVKSASYSLAFLLYNQGSLDPDSLNEAFRTAEIAAFAWDERCQYLLGLMYYEGKAIDQDMEKAYFWLDIAASAGVFESHHIRALAADSLTTEQIQSVKSRAKKWFNDNHDRPHEHIFIDNAIHRYK